MYKVYNTVDFPREFEDNVIVLMMVSKLIDVYIVLYSTSRLNTNYLLIIKVYYFVVKFRTFYYKDLTLSSDLVSQF